ncbi:hypothetical protein TWF481_006905 [Arthrobotrys musiformis]|uniref:F-box domain-containing protein n=1 Tax=Arthrobotrys musiformis TaxID=47236 RepID=A0AAV9W9Y9_9PEZI
MPEILDCPLEILDLIIDELARSPALPSELVDSVHQRLFRRVLPLGRTCRFFYQYILPRLYSDCFLEFRDILDEGPEYRLYDSSVLRTIKRYNGFFKHGAMVRNLNVRFGGRANWIPPAQFQGLSDKIWFDFHEVSRPVPSVLEGLVPRFDNLRRAEFQRDIESRGCLGEFVEGLGLVLSGVASLTELDLSIQYNADDENGWVENWEYTKYPCSAAQLQYLSISIEPKVRYLDPDRRREPLGWDVEFQQNLWFMDFLVGLLRLPSRTVRTLNFEFIFEEFEKSPLACRSLNYGEQDKTVKDEKRLELPLLEKLYLTLGGGCQYAYWRYFKVVPEEVRDLSLQLVTLPRGTWSNEITFIKSFPKLTALTLYHPRDIEPVEAVVASRAHFTCLKELTVLLFTPSSQITAIIDKFKKDPLIQIEKFDSSPDSATICLQF